MQRNALRKFFERVIVASLPLAAAACGGGNGTMPPTGGNGTDMAMVVAADDLALPASAEDLAGMTAMLDMVSFDLDTCEVQHPITPVNIPADKMPDMGFQTLCIANASPCTDVCPTGYTQCCSPKPSDGGAFLATCVYNCGPSGRRPAGLEEAHGTDGCAVGQYFASMAHLEAASVSAFRAMARELAAHGAPSSLVSAARRAARDEIRHARLTRRMAGVHGSQPAPVRVTPPASRSLETIAVENAVEGCVRETFGALLASWQARAAGDVSVREMMSEIALDETRHAQLAWALDAWAKRQLDRGARRRIVDARRAAATALAEEMRQEPPAELVERVGLPDAARARQFVAAATQELWS